MAPALRTVILVFLTLFSRPAHLAPCAEFPDSSTFLLPRNGFSVNTPTASSSYRNTKVIERRGHTLRRRQFGLYQEIETILNNPEFADVFDGNAPVLVSDPKRPEAFWNDIGIKTPFPTPDDGTFTAVYEAFFICTTKSETEADFHDSMMTFLMAERELIDRAIETAIKELHGKSLGPINSDSILKLEPLLKLLSWRKYKKSQFKMAFLRDSMIKVDHTTIAGLLNDYKANKDSKLWWAEHGSEIVAIGETWIMIFKVLAGIHEDYILQNALTSTSSMHFEGRHKQRSTLYNQLWRNMVNIRNTVFYGRERDQMDTVISDLLMKKKISPIMLPFVEPPRTSTADWSSISFLLSKPQSSAIVDALRKTIDIFNSTEPAQHWENGERTKLHMRAPHINAKEWVQMELQSMATYTWDALTPFNGGTNLYRDTLVHSLEYRRKPPTNAWNLDTRIGSSLMAIFDPLLKEDLHIDPKTGKWRQVVFLPSP